MLCQTLLKRAPTTPFAGSYARSYFSTRSRFLVETSEVEELMKANDPTLRFINASWYLPGGNVDAKTQHEEHRLTENTQYMSISEVVEPGSDLPNKMPSVGVFTEHMRKLRVRKDDQIICYDHPGMFSVARCAWLLRFYGAGNVRIMNGGFQKWLKEGRPFFSGPYTPGVGLPEGGDYSYAAKNPDAVITDINKVHDIARKLHDGSSEYQITDARPAARFNGEMPEPRGMRAGQITGSTNMPFGELVDPKTGCLLTDQQLKEVFAAKGIDLGKKTVHSCGSGVTACTVQLAWEICGGAGGDAMYDGSWSEYGRVDEPDFSKKI